MIFSKLIVISSIFLAVQAENKGRCDYRCKDANGKLISGIQSGVPNNSCAWHSCHSCNMFGCNCDYCRLTYRGFERNDRDIAGLSAWCRKQGGKVAATNCGYNDSDEC